jgi:hypothetical protein
MVLINMNPNLQLGIKTTPKTEGISAKWQTHLALSVSGQYKVTSSKLLKFSHNIRKVAKRSLRNNKIAVASTSIHIVCHLSTFPPPLKQRYLRIGPWFDVRPPGGARRRNPVPLPPIGGGMGFSLYPMKTSTRMLWSTSFFRHKLSTSF